MSKTAWRALMGLFWVILASVALFTEGHQMAQHIIGLAIVSALWDISSALHGEGKKAL